jgi:LmbE family N-acetylglucosaminyl deacetylase
MSTQAPIRHARLLACLAHPDDESFGMGGTLALYARRKAEVHLLCATRGEAGTVSSEKLMGHASVAELRESELRCAAQTLGLAGVDFLGYRDSGMAGSEDNRHPQALAAAPLADVTGRIVEHIRRLRPQVVLTFDPRGGYGHPDHIAMHQATVRAFHQAADPACRDGSLEPYAPQKLYFQVFPRTNLRRYARLLPLLGIDPRHFGRNRDIDLLEIASVVFPVHARVDIRPTLQEKTRASDCHSSQERFSQGGLVGWLFRSAQYSENFMRAHPPAPLGLQETDLFEGVLAD